MLMFRVINRPTTPNTTQSDQFDFDEKDPRRSYQDPISTVPWSFILNVSKPSVFSSTNDITVR